MCYTKFIMEKIINQIPFAFAHADFYACNVFSGMPKRKSRVQDVSRTQLSMTSVVQSHHFLATLCVPSLRPQAAYSTVKCASFYKGRINTGECTDTFGEKKSHQGNQTSQGFTALRNKALSLLHHPLKQGQKLGVSLI